MASGVAVADACKEVYQQVKMNIKGKEKFRYAVFRIADSLKEIETDTDRMGTASDMDAEEPAHFQRIISGLPADDGRYIIYDYPFQGSFGPTSKIILVLWVPEGISIKKKMLYASSKDALKKSFPDCSAEFQADCPDDLSHKDIEGKLRKV